tara:strand:+ start:336 stop:515 length:180 start_codon:yes stop_codon:yes gene_type:complete
MKIYLIWLIGVIVWNYGVPQATPLEDVLVAIALSFLTMCLKKYLNLITQMKNKYFGNKK